mmetsp:Transcript_46019/g.147056  ORF Transcript_46019/g.147056 Transcript_46019/m.147056 type:complete len:229 (-) Transcript_46019:4238-4924(-)
MTCRVRCISASTASIQFSTAPSVDTGCRKSNFSPSLDVIPTTCLLPRAKVRLAQLSKSLSMCSCTDVGSEVPRMERSSSSEMKKKRGKLLRLVSRYSVRDFWHVSSSSLSFCSWSRRPSTEHASRMLVFLAVVSMIFFHALSMRSKRLASSGSWWRMSSEPTKMLSRYIHFLCTTIHTSVTSPMSERRLSHRRTSSRKGFTKRLAIMDCRLRPMSSSSTATSSVARRM